MKKKIAIIFGGQSTEHEISIISAQFIQENINKNKYEIFPIYIDKQGIWYSCQKGYYRCKEIDKTKIIKIKDIFSKLKSVDIIFPVLHGKYGEDGTIQGIFEILRIPYVGCGVLSSAIGMDKVYTKTILNQANVKQAKYIYLKKEKETYTYINNQFEETKDELPELCKIIEKQINYPMFIKPSNSGSSIGIGKAYNQNELKKYIENASQYDDKIIIEENIVGREIECSVLGNTNIRVSCLGEIITTSDFYTYDAKYKNKESKIIIPATISKKLTDEIRRIAKKAFMAIDGKGLARIDFFVNDKSNEIYLNEINTLPGFTQISMYPKLWEQSGINNQELIDELINLAQER